MRTALVTALLCGLLTMSALAATQSAMDRCTSSAPASHAPASAFAPHHNLKRRSYGSPIQRPILKRVKRKKPAPH